MGNIQPNGLSHIFLDLLHGLTRQCIDQIDGDIVKTSQFQTIDIFINFLLQMTAPNLFSILSSKVCTPSETRLTAEFFKTAILSASKSPGLASMVNSSKTDKSKFFSQALQ